MSRLDFFGQALSVGDEVVFCYRDRKLSLARVTNLHEVHSLPLISIDSLDGRQRLIITSDEVVQVNRE